MSKYNLAIIGCGGIAGDVDDDPKKRHIYSHAKAISMIEQIQIIACCDVDEAALNKFSKKWNVANKYTNLDEMIDEEYIDILVVATPTKYHYDHVKKALSNSINVVFCEKTLTYNLQQGVEISDIADKQNSLLIVNFMRRWDRFYIECKELLDSGDLGSLETIVVYVDTALYMNSSHMLDLIVYFGGDVNSVVGHIDRFNKPRIVHGEEDFGAIAMITHKNGIITFLKATGESQRNHYYEMDFQCTKGRLKILNDDIKYEVYKFEESPQHKGLDELKLQHTELNKDNDERIVNAYLEIINFLEHKKHPTYTASESLKSLELISLIYESDSKNHSTVYSKL